MQKNRYEILYVCMYYYVLLFFRTVLFDKNGLLLKNTAMVKLNSGVCKKANLRNYAHAA